MKRILCWIIGHKLDKRRAILILAMTAAESKENIRPLLFEILLEMDRKEMGLELENIVNPYT